MVRTYFVLGHHLVCAGPETLALAALLATPGSAFMPTVAPVLRARSPMLSSPDARARLAGKRGDGGALFLIASTGFTVEQSGPRSVIARMSCPNRPGACNVTG